MPRPGPRPYECVKRAWHSDRHQPMRGSIIQHIFRLVSESHSAVTKKNKEWQEKVPIVVLKAEEIMYSKANSEAEYLNPETLWDRVNDAINTIIRRDENTESGDLLPPCVEAALNLGCSPVRASRSQRHSNPRSYLSPRAQEPTSAPPRIFDRTSYEQRPQLSQVHGINQLNFARANTVNPALLVSESSGHLSLNANLAGGRGYRPSLENVLLAGRNQLMRLERNTPQNFGTVYPLYHGTHYQTGESQLGSRIREEPHSETVFVGKPVINAIGEPDKMVVLQNFFSGKNSENALKRFTPVNVLDTQEKPQERDCDLSLRLGFLSPSSMSNEKTSACETDDGSTSSQDGGKVSDLSPQQNSEFCFFPRRAAYETLSSSKKRNLEGEGQNLEMTRRNRKAPFSYNNEDE